MSKDSGNSFFTFLSGVAIGALVGVLYAPEKGKDTRDRLSYRLDKYKERLQEILNELIEGEAEEENVEDKATHNAHYQKVEQIMSEIDALQDTIHNSSKKS